MEPKKLCYCMICKNCYKDDDSTLAVYFNSYNNFYKEFGICYECIDEFKGARN